MRPLLLTLACACATPAIAQSFHGISRNTTDSVVLRWAPASVEAWLTGMRSGYRIERLPIDGNTAARSKAEPIGPAAVLPLSLEQMAGRYGKTHPTAGAMAQLLHGEGEKAPARAGDMAAAALTADLQRMRWSTCLLLADLDAGMADAAGLRFVDRSARMDLIYLYRIIALDTALGDTVLVAVDRRKEDPVPDGPELRAQEEEQRVSLSWTSPIDMAYFTGYWIERSTDGRSWERMNSTPYVPGTDAARDGGLVWWTDTMITRNYVPLHYRVLGITPFGDVSMAAPDIVAMGRDRTPPPPPQMGSVVDEGGRMSVSWSHAGGTPDLAGFRVEKALTADGVYGPLHASLLPTTSTSFTDPSPALLEGNHFRVAAIDTAGNASYSIGGYGFLQDSIAPAAPTGLSGRIDTSGVVRVSWRQGDENDILGYRVFFANAEDHEFNNLTPLPVADTVFTDTLQVRTLTRRIHYRVVAVDRNYNHSRFSGMLTLARPDVVAPVTPVFKHYLVSDTAVVLNFIPSTSSDVKLHRLLRKAPGEDVWSEVVAMPAAEGRRSWTDRDVSGPAFYSYTLVAVDSAGNSSPQTLPLEVRVHKRLKHAGVSAVKTARMDEGVIQVSWGPAPGRVHHYVIYRSLNSAPPLAVGHTDGGNRSYTDIRLPGKGSYLYSVVAVFEDGMDSGPVQSATPLVIP